MDWGAADEKGPDWPDQSSRRAIVIGALRGLVRALEDEDTEAAAEQAGGSDERGGLMTHGFANEHIEIGDLNTSNLERRLNSIQWGGRTYIMPAWKAALADYDEEFGDRDPDEQPVMEVVVVTDGEADDWMEFEPVLEKATAKRVFVVAIVGHGAKHDATLKAYQERRQEEPGPGQVRQEPRQGSLVRLRDRPGRDRDRPGHPGRLRASPPGGSPARVGRAPQGNPGAARLCRTGDLVPDLHGDVPFVCCPLRITPLSG